MKYLIKVHYTTGDSYDNYETSDVLELTWNNIEVAKANLKRIQEHYMCYRVDNDYSGKNGTYFHYMMNPDQKLMYDLRTQQDWYVESPNGQAYHHSIILKADNGNDWRISPFWVGYFETLREVEIIIDQNDMKISF